MWAPICLLGALERALPAMQKAVILGVKVMHPTTNFAGGPRNVIAGLERPSTATGFALIIA